MDVGGVGVARQDYASVNGRRRGWRWRRREAIPLLEGETGQRKKMDEREAEGARGSQREKERTWTRSSEHSSE